MNCRPLVAEFSRHIPIIMKLVLCKWEYLDTLTNYCVSTGEIHASYFLYFFYKRGNQFREQT